MGKLVLKRLLGAALGWAALAAGQTAAQEKVDLILNFVASGDHAPYFHARKLGWYKQAGIDLGIELGQGSGVAVQRVGIGKNQIGIADLGNAMVGRGKDADVVAVMAIYANSPYGMYWLKSSGIAGPKDFAGKRFGVPPGDAGRVMWPAFARAVGIDPAAVQFVNVAPLAKLQALLGKSIDFTQSFYSGHAFFSKGLGADMGFLRWKDIGINPYSNALIVNGAFLKSKPAVVENFVRVSQRAFLACWDNPDPCLQSLLADNSGLTLDGERATWKLVRELMDDTAFRKEALGWFDPARVASDYELVDRYFTLDKKFDPALMVTNRYLDRTIRLP
jgi:NitT/TauT family transport system substrate-binding protein